MICAAAARTLHELARERERERERGQAVRGGWRDEKRASTKVAWNLEEPAAPGSPLVTAH